MMEEQFFIFGSYVESIYGNSEINRYQQWLEITDLRKIRH